MYNSLLSVQDHHCAGTINKNGGIGSLFQLRIKTQIDGNSDIKGAVVKEGLRVFS